MVSGQFQGPKSYNILYGWVGHSPTNNFAKNFYFENYDEKLDKILFGLKEIKAFPAISEV